MALFNKETPEDKQERKRAEGEARQKQAEERERALAESKRQEEETRRKKQEEAQEAAFRATAQGQARTAFEERQTYFQTCLTVAATDRSGMSMISGSVEVKSRPVDGQGEIITSIESEGWKLAHVGFVFQETGSVSRDKLLSSGQVALVTGQVVGIYVFEVCPDNRKPIEERHETTAQPLTSRAT